MVNFWAIKIVDRIDQRPLSSLAGKCNFAKNEVKLLPKPRTILEPCATVREHAGAGQLDLRKAEVAVTNCARIAGLS